MQSYSTLKAVTTRATVSGLKPGTRYVFQVRARTSAGCGRFSQAMEVETGKPSECRGRRACGRGRAGPCAPRPSQWDSVSASAGGNLRLRGGKALAQGHRAHSPVPAGFPEPPDALASRTSAWPRQRWWAGVIHSPGHRPGRSGWPGGSQQQVPVTPSPCHPAPSLQMLPGTSRWLSPGSSLETLVPRPPFESKTLGSGAQQCRSSQALGGILKHPKFGSTGLGADPYIHHLRLRPAEVFS